MRKSNFKPVALAVILTLVVVSATLMVGLGLLVGSPFTKPGVNQIDVQMPQNWTISSGVEYHGSLYLSCFDPRSSFSSIDSAILSYHPGDRSFSVHPIDISSSSGAEISLHVVNDQLYLFYFATFSMDYNTYRCFVVQVYTNNWTLGSEIQISTPRTLSPGMEVSDGDFLYILGGRTTDTTPPYGPPAVNDTMYKANVTDGKVTAVDMIPGLSDQAGVFIGGDLTLFDGGFGGYSRMVSNCHVDWSSMSIYHLNDGSIEIPENRSVLSSFGLLPATDGSSLYFFDPLIYNSTSGWFEPSHQIWKMANDGTVTRFNVTLPADVGGVIPFRLGDGFVLLYQDVDSTRVWYCNLKGIEELPLIG